MANTIIANTSVDTNQNEAFLVVYDADYINADSSVGRTYNKDLGITFAQLTAAGTDLSLLNIDLSTDTNWTAFLSGMTASTKWAVVDGSLNAHGAFITGGDTAPQANTDPSVLIFNSLDNAITQHAAEINMGLTNASSLIIVADDFTGQADHDGSPFSSLWTGINTSGTGFDPLTAFGSTAQFYKGSYHLDKVTDYSGLGADTVFGTPVTTQADITKLGQLTLTASGLKSSSAALPNSKPTLDAPTVINYTDTKFVDTFKSAFGLLHAKDIDSNTTLTYGIDGNGLTENTSHTTVSQSNAYGVLTVTKATGAYSFVANNSAIEALTTNKTATFTVNSSDGKLTDSKTLTINITQNGKTESNGNDSLTGTQGNDNLNGLAGNDKINGLRGNDFITGGLGKDLLTGDTGKDTFDFNSISDSKKGASRDSITDFSHGQHDKIDLSGIDAKIGTKADDKFAFIGSSAFHHKAGELHLVNGILSGDTNGDAKADFEIAIVGAHTLANADFAL